MSDKYHGMLREQLRLQHESLIRQRKMCLRQLSQHLSTLCQTEKERLLSNQKTHYQFELARAQARLKGVEGMVDTVASSGNSYIYIHTGAKRFCLKTSSYIELTCKKEGKLKPVQNYCI